MAGNFGDYHFTDEQLTSIITQTDNAIQEFNRVNTAVGGSGEQLPVANQSDSGSLLGGHLTQWNSDFNQCVTNLQDLNHKATALRTVNLNADATSTEIAR
jgi:hypothetical protein